MKCQKCDGSLQVADVEHNITLDPSGKNSIGIDLVCMECGTFWCSIIILDDLKLEEVKN